MKTKSDREGEFTTKELNEIEKLLHTHKNALLEQLEKFYKGEKVTAIRL